MAVTVSVDKKACIGCGACVATASDVFEFDKDHKASVKKTAKIKSDSQVMGAAKACPVTAIHVVVDGKKKI